MTDMKTYRTKNIYDIGKALDDIYITTLGSKENQKFKIMFSINNNDYTLYDIKDNSTSLTLRFKKNHKNIIDGNRVNYNRAITIINHLTNSIKRINTDNPAVYSNDLLKKYEIMLCIDNRFKYTDAIKDILNNKNEAIVLRTEDFNDKEGEYVSYIDYLNSQDNNIIEYSILLTPILKDYYSIDISITAHTERYEPRKNSAPVNKDILKRAVNKIV